MARWSARLAGIVAGLLLALATAVALEAWRAPAPAAVAQLVPDCEGALTELVIHRRADTAVITADIYRTFLGHLPESVTVHVVCPTAEDYSSFAASVGDLRCRLNPVVVDHPVTCWSRDRWLALDDGTTRTLLVPAKEDGAEGWPMRAGDARVGDDLAAVLADVACTRSRWDFDGGDVVADAGTAFVAEAVLRKNLGHRAPTPGAIVAALEKRLGRRVVLFETAPDHHAGMYLMPVGDGRVVVGDPSLAAPLRRASTGWTPCGDDFSPELQARFDAVAARCRAAGYAVTRVPVVPGSDGRTWLSYVNGIADDRDGERIFYLPTFAHAPRLNALATGIWEDLGYRVVPIDCTDAYVHFGTLRCLVNVLRRG